MHTTRPLAALLATLATACAPPRFVAVRAPTRDAPVEIRQVRLQWSNVFVLREGDARVLVDAGSPGDGPALDAALRADGLAPRDLRLVVLTHGHSDHVGLAARLQADGVPIALGLGDGLMAAAGLNDTMRPTGALGTMLQPVFDFAHARFVADVWLGAPRDLAAYGLPAVRVEPMAGHTRGSVVVWVGATDVIVGDMLLGGLFGDGTDALEHYYQDDPRANHCAIEQLLRRGARRFYLGHGGPVEHATLRAWRASHERELRGCP